MDLFKKVDLNQITHFWKAKSVLDSAAFSNSFFNILDTGQGSPFSVAVE